MSPLRIASDRNPSEAGFARSRLSRIASLRPVAFRHHGSTVIKFSTLETPGAAQAARSASCFSANERTVPRSVTLRPSTSTVTRLASTAALRLKASSILFLSSVGETRGFTVIRLLMPITPAKLRTADSADSF